MVIMITKGLLMHTFAYFERQYPEQMQLSQKVLLQAYKRKTAKDPFVSADDMARLLSPYINFVDLRTITALVKTAFKDWADVERFVTGNMDTLKTVLKDKNFRLAVIRKTPLKGKRSKKRPK